MKIISSEKMTLLSNLLHNDEMAKLTSQLCNRYPHVQTGQTFDTVLAKVVELNKIYLEKKLCLPQSRHLNIELHFLLGWFYRDNPLYTEIIQLAEYHGEEDATKRALRIHLSRKVGEVIATGFGLLGIEVPERM